MASPPAHKPARGPGAFFGNLFKLRKNNSWSELKEGSSRRGRRTDVSIIFLPFNCKIGDSVLSINVVPY